jgi:hypothetical protein
MKLKLGKLPPKFNRKTLHLSKYMLATAPAAPPTAGWEHLIPATGWQMFDNDSIGDCTCACAAHMVMNWTSNTGTLVTPKVADVVKLYSEAGGYVPGDPSTDNGAAITDVLEIWQKTGLGSDKIDGWAQIDFANIETVRQAIYLFGAVNVGVNLPNVAETQFENGQPWELEADDGGIAGGHCVPVFGYNEAIGGTAVTWGRTQPFSWAWWVKYVEEAYVTISMDWLKASTVAPNHLDLAQLEADLKAIQD